MHYNTIQYTIDSNYADELEVVFFEKYMTDTMYDEQNRVIMEVLFAMPSFDAKQMSYTIARNWNASDYLRSCSISKLYELGDTLPAINLLFEKTPKISNYWCNVFSPFQASSKLSFEFIEPLLDNLKQQEHRSTILGLMTDLAKENKEEYIQAIRENYDVIMSFFVNKVDSVKNESLYDMLYYTDFLGQYEDKRNNAFIESIDTSGLPLFGLASLAAAKINNKMPLDPIMLNDLIKDNYFKFNIQKALFQKGVSKLLPDSLTTSNSVYLSKIQHYLEDEYWDDCESTLLGTIKDEANLRYYVYKVIDSSDEDVCALGLVNQTNKKGRYIFDDIKAYSVYMKGCDFSKWKSIAQENLEDFKEYAY